MKRATHILALGLALLLSGQAYALFTPATVACKHAGAAEKPCRCPHSRPDPSGAELGSAACCELSAADSTQLPPSTVVPAPDLQLVGVGVQLAGDPAVSVSVWAADEAPASAVEPHTYRRFIRLRHLLI